MINLNNKKVAITPYNDLSQKLKEFIEEKCSIQFVCYIDSNKTGDKIYNPKQIYLLDADYILISNSRFNKNIYENLKIYTSKEKCILMNEYNLPYSQITHKKLDLTYLIKTNLKTKSKYINNLFLIFMFFLKPQSLYKYSWRKGFPSPDCKDIEKEKISDIFNISYNTNFQYEILQRNIYMRGADRDLHIQDQNNVLVNIIPTSKNKNNTFATADNNVLKTYLKEEVDVIFTELVLVNSHKTHKILNPLDKDISCKKITLYIHTNNNAEYFGIGSGISTILSLSLISSNLKVYGFNHYLPYKLSQMNLFTLIKHIFFYQRDYRTFDYVECSLFHLFFAYYFEKEPTIDINGNIDYFKNSFYDELLTKRLKKIYLKEQQ